MFVRGKTTIQNGTAVIKNQSTMMNIQNTQIAVIIMRKGIKNMIQEIKGKPIKGYRYSDGVHWYWGDEEIAVINDNQEIEWYKRTHNYPEEVVNAIRERKQYPAASWLIEVHKVSVSATQGYYQICINGRDIMRFGAEKKSDESGQYVFDIPDDELGRLLIALFWHKFDHVYHYSNIAKDIFYPEWNKDDPQKEYLPNQAISEFVMQMIENFEDFLEQKQIVIENPEKQEAIDAGEDVDSIANIYGTDYGILQQAIEEMLIAWNIWDVFQTPGKGE